LRRTSANPDEFAACTRFAHAALQATDVHRESYRSIIGATHKRCAKLFIRFRISTLSRSNKLLERLVILARCSHDWLRCATTECSQVGSRVRVRGMSVHALRTRVRHLARAVREHPRPPVSTADSTDRRNRLGTQANALRNRLTPVTVPSVQPDRDVEVPGSANLDHVELAGHARREYLVGRLALNDASYRFVDGRHAAGLNEGH
jgi:hypothetical protein